MALLIGLQPVLTALWLSISAPGMEVMAWSVFVLTLGGSSLLYLLIQCGAATQVTSLLYLVPPCTALMAWALFDEPITMAMLLGVVLTAVGVGSVVRIPTQAAKLP